jgi:hypothetical protein
MIWREPTKNPFSLLKAHSAQTFQVRSKSSATKIRANQSRKTGTNGWGDATFKGANTSTQPR